MIAIDIAFLVIIVISAFLSLLRGLTREVLSVAAWVIAFLVARMFNPQAAQWVSSFISLPSAQWAVGFGLLFLATLLAMGLVNYLVGRVIAATGLSATDRVLGIVFGVLRGAAVVTLLVFLASFTPMTKDPWWKQSSVVSMVLPIAQWLRGKIPPEFDRYLPE